MASARSARPVLRVPATHSQVPGKQPPLQEVPTAAAAGPRIAGRASACPPAAEHAPSAAQPHSPHGALCRSQTLSQARRGCLGAGLTRAPPPAPWPACLYGTDFLARAAQAVPRCMILPPMSSSTKQPTRSKYKHARAAVTTSPASTSYILLSCAHSATHALSTLNPLAIHKFTHRQKSHSVLPTHQARPSHGIILSHQTHTFLSHSGHQSHSMTFTQSQRTSMFH